MMQEDRGPPAGAVCLGRLLRRATSGSARAAPAAEAHRAFAAALASGKDGVPPASSAGRAHALRWAAAGLAGAAVVVAVAVARPARPLTFRVDSLATGAAGSSAIEARAASGTMRFSDGSVLELERGARARVLGVDARGARLAIEHGDVDFQIRHRRETSWSIAAGPFEILVTGTAFDVRWTDDRQLRVRLRDGAVLVRGSLAGAGLMVKAGQALVARLDVGEMRLGRDDGAHERDLETAPVSEVRGVTPSASAPAPDAPAPAASLPATATPAAKRIGGRHPKLVEEIAPPALAPRADSADDCVARCDDEGLDALARTARRGRDLDVARRALLALRARHPASPLAHDAAFVLGRLDEDQGRPADALRFYDAYLDEDGGAYRPFALGRKVVLVEHLLGAASARPVAELYLRLYPNGAHGAYARQLLSKP